jgi:hypothetical protein
LHRTRRRLAGEKTEEIEGGPSRRKEALAIKPALVYVLVMFSFFERRNNGMAFSAQVRELSRAQVARFAEETLNAYLDGREKAYAVRLVIDEVQAVFSSDCLAAELIEQMLVCEDEDWRVALATKATDLLHQQVRADTAEIHGR